MSYFNNILDGTAQKTPQQLRQQAARLVQNTTDEKLLMINESGER